MKITLEITTDAADLHELRDLSNAITEEITASFGIRSSRVSLGYEGPFVTGVAVLA